MKITVIKNTQFPFRVDFGNGSGALMFTEEALIELQGKCVDAYTKYKKLCVNDAKDGKK